MLNNIKKTALLFVVFLHGCSSDFLDNEPTGFGLTPDQIKTATKFNPDVIKGNVAGLYQLMYLPGSSGKHNDFGQKGVDIWTDMLSADMAHTLRAYDWYSSFSDLHDTLDPRADCNIVAWRYYYKIIRSANSIIKSLGGNDATPISDQNKYFMGQAKAMRAYSYFYLIQLYTDKYEPKSKSLPLYIEPQAYELGKSTTGKIYEQIYKDLNDALDLLSGFNRETKSEINQDVVKLLLAYAYASEDRNWDKVKTLTSEVIASGYEILKKNDLLKGMNDLSEPGWIWGSDITLDDNIKEHAFFYHMDQFTYGYAAGNNHKSIDVSLHAKMRKDDQRKEWFKYDKFKLFKSKQDEILINWRKFAAPHTDKPGVQSIIATDVHYMRIAEVYLLNAEASLKANDVNNAKKSLKAVVSERVADASYIDIYTNEQLAEEIILQTRLELWGEGKTYLLIRRNKLKVTRGLNHFNFTGVEMSYDDNRLSFEIPEYEILNNPFINSQN